jgi:hypothetical protein
VMVQTMPRRTGRISITATHTQLGRAQVELMVRAQ